MLAGDEAHPGAAPGTIPVGDPGTGPRVRHGGEAASRRAGFVSKQPLSDGSSTLSAPTEETTAATAIRPFPVPTTSRTELEALRARIIDTRWPDPELVDDFSQGVQQTVMQELARYWATDYDLGRCEARLSALPHFVTEIDGVDIHFIN